MFNIKGTCLYMKYCSDNIYNGGMVTALCRKTPRSIIE